MPDRDAGRLFVYSNMDELKDKLKKLSLFGKSSSKFHGKANVLGGAPIQVFAREPRRSREPSCRGLIKSCPCRAAARSCRATPSNAASTVGSRRQWWVRAGREAGAASGRVAPARHSRSCFRSPCHHALAAITTAARSTPSAGGTAAAGLGSGAKLLPADSGQRLGRACCRPGRAATPRGLVAGGGPAGL